MLKDVIGSIVIQYLAVMMDIRKSNILTRNIACIIVPVKIVDVFLGDNKQ
jgi:hypothetical protein